MASRPSLLGVLYAEDFGDDGDGPAADGVPEPELIEPTFTAAELEAARAEAREAGRLEAERGLLASRAQLLSQIASGLGDARAEAAGMAEAAAEATAKLMLAMVAACLPTLCERHGALELQTVIRLVLPAMRDEPKITVRVNPHMIAAVQEEVATLDIELVDRVQVLGTDSLPPGDARISWADGGAVRNMRATRAAVHEALSSLGLLEQELADA